jgi:hypothetical protein
VKQLFLNSLKYCKDIEAEQAKHPGKCIYHLSKSQLKADCHVKKECEKLSNTVKTSGTNSYSQATQPVSNGQLCHLTEEVFEDAFDSAASNDLVESANDTNEADLLYFARVTNHYLCLVKAAPFKTLPSYHQLKYPVIADSGANFHMFKEKEFFESLVPAIGSVILGDGTTRLPIHGVGTVKFFIGDQLLRLDNVRYVPSLSESIYSFFLRIKQPNHGLESSFEGGYF